MPESQLRAARWWMVSQTKHASRQLFNNSYTLSVAAQIAHLGAETFTQRSLAQQLAVPDNLIAGPLRRLRELGLVTATKDGMLQRNTGSDAFWDAVLTIRDVLVSSE